MYSKFLFIFSATVLSAEASNGLSRNNRNETLWNKLIEYKDLTGISDDEMLSIWKKHEQIKVGEGNTFPKFRVAMSKPIPSGTVNPVFFDTLQFNEQIELVTLNFSFMEIPTSFYEKSDQLIEFCVLELV